MSARVAGLNADNVVTDVFVVDDFVRFAEREVLTIGIRWPGGLCPVRDDEPVRIGSTRNPDGSWSDPVTPVEVELRRVGARTSRMFEQGFLFREKAFSLSLASQLSVLGLYNVRTHAGALPRLWPTLDDSDFIRLETPQDVEDFYAAQVFAVLDLRSVAAEQKQDLRAKS